jgi:general transcription factor 3C polypeptide 3 (transcription factor C subunit 4)
MNSQNSYYDQWLSAQPPNGRRFVPVSGTFSGVPAPGIARPQPHNNQPQYPVHYPQGQFLISKCIQSRLKLPSLRSSR